MTAPRRPSPRLAFATCLLAAIGLAPARTAAQDLNGANLNLTGVITQSGSANNYFNGAYSSFDGSLCIGNGCAASGESNGLGNPPLKLKWSEAAIIFEDTSTTTFADRDWRVAAGGSSAQETFSIIDEGTDWTDGSEVTPFTIVGGAPANAFWIDGTGNIGLGTSIPAAELHIKDGSLPAIRLEQDGSEGQTPQVWQVDASHAWFRLYDLTSGVAPIFVKKGIGNNYGVVIDDAGQVGLGAFSPAAALHLLRSNGTAKALIQENSASSGPRTLLELRNFGRPEIVMANTDTGGEWSFGAGTNFILKQGAVGSASSAKTKLFEVTAAGNAVLAGSLTTGGTTCGGGCDRVFAPDYPLPSIAEHAAQMRALGYLPNVGPTPEGAPIDVTDKLGRMLNELEHAHLYIATLEAETSALRAELRAELRDIRSTLASLD